MGGSDILPTAHVTCSPKRRNAALAHCLPWQRRHGCCCQSRQRARRRGCSAADPQTRCAGWPRPRPCWARRLWGGCQTCCCRATGHQGGACHLRRREKGGQRQRRWGKWPRLSPIVAEVAQSAQFGSQRRFKKAADARPREFGWPGGRALRPLWGAYSYLKTRVRLFQYLPGDRRRFVLSRSRRPQLRALGC